MPTAAEDGAQDGAGQAGAMRSGQPSSEGIERERVPVYRTAAGSGSAAVRRDLDRDLQSAMPRPPPPSDLRPAGFGFAGGRQARQVGSTGPGISGVGRAQIFGPGTRGVVAASAHNRYNNQGAVESGGLFGPPPRAAAGFKSQAPAGGRGGGLRLAPHLGAAGPMPANYEMPANSVPLSAGQYVTVCSKEELMGMLTSHWNGHYNQVVGGKLVGSVYRRSNNLVYVHFIGEGGFPCGFTFPYGALIPFEGEPPSQLQGYVKQRPPPAAVMSRGNSGRSRQMGMGGMQVMPARGQNAAVNGGRSRTCSIQ